MVPGAAPLIFNVALLPQSCRQEELEEAMSGLCGATGRAQRGKAFLSHTAWQMSIAPTLFSPWLNSEKARAACGLQWDNRTADPARVLNKWGLGVPGGRFLETVGGKSAGASQTTLHSYGIKSLSLLSEEWSKDIQGCCIS